MARALPVRECPSSPEAGSKHLALSRMQLRMWMGQRFDAHATGYHMAFAFAFGGALDPARFDAAFQAVLDRCDALRTVIEETGDGPRQRAVPPFRFAVEEVDLSGAPDPEAALEGWLDERLAHPLRLDERLFDAALLRTGEGRHVWYLNLHHIIADGWSYGLLFRRVAEAYARAGAGTLDALPAWPSFREYLANRPQVRRVAASANGEPLQFFGETPVNRTARERRISLPLGDERMARLNALAASEDARSLHAHLARTNILAALLFTYLHQVTGRRRLVLGMPFHNRLDEASRVVAGLLQETLPVAVEIDEGETFISLLEKTARATWTAMRKARSGVVEEDPRAYEVMFNYPNVTFSEFDGMPVAPRWLHPGFGDGRRLLFVQAHDFGATDRLTLDVDANAGVFDEARHRRAADQLAHLFDQCLAGPSRRLDGLDLMPPGERARVVTGFNRTAAAFPAHLTLADLFERQAERTPDATAMVFGGATLTYAELDARANRWAHELRRRGVGPGVPVGVFAERSPELMAALPALFKAGGAYLPLDVAYPRERLAFMLADARAPLVLTQARLRAKLPPGDFDVLCLDAPAPDAPASPPSRPSTTPADLAYVIYTSGSTGRPKGVAMPMRAITNLVWWQMHTATRLTRPRTFQFTPLGFDVSLQEIFACWCAGGTLVVPTDAVRRDPEAALRLLIDERVEQLYVIYSPLRRLAETAVRLGLYPRSLREVITAGEQVQVTPALVRFFENLPDCTFENQYGPSETHIVTRHPLTGKPKDWPVLPPIGRPIANTEIYLLDPHLRPVPVGMPGELFIGGVQVADGYLNRPELTAKRFVRDPFSGREGGRLYRTGDLGRFLPNGDIAFLGRKDFQVKVRGYRIELGEIEAVLGRHPAVREAAVTMREDAPGDRRLAAYLVPHAAPPPAEELRRFLGETLPEYMIPSHFVTLDAMPHTPNGKVDRRALPAPEGRPVLETAYAEPRAGVEETIAAVWREVLRLERVGRRDNFFTLGGDSLMLVEVHARLRERFEALSIVDLFEYPTIDALARFLREEETPGAGAERARARASRQKEALRRRTERQERRGGSDAANGTHNDGGNR